MTCVAVRIQHPANAPAMIDEAISTALRERKPAYIEIPCNLSSAPCSPPTPFSTLQPGQLSNARMLADAVGRATDLIAEAKKPILLAGAHLRPYGAIEAFRELAEALGCAVAVMPNAKGFFPKTTRNTPASTGARSAARSASHRRLVRPHRCRRAGVQRLHNRRLEAQPPRQRLINAEAQGVRFADTEYTGVALADFLSDLAKKVQANDATLTQYKRWGTASVARRRWPTPRLR